MAHGCGPPKGRGGSGGQQVLEGVSYSTQVLRSLLYGSFRHVLLVHARVLPGLPWRHILNSTSSLPSLLLPNLGHLLLSTLLPAPPRAFPLL